MLKRQPQKYRFSARLLGLVAFSALISSMATASTNIEVVVPPMDASVSSNNREAHFNWLLESESGVDPEIGQFADKTWWVAPAQGDTGVRLLSLTGSEKPGQTDLLTMDDDPIPHANGLVGLGAKTWGSYDPNQDEVPKLPVLYTPEHGSAISLVAAMQRNEDETSKGGTKAIVGAVVDAYCILTVLPEPPPNGGSTMIRPNFLGDKKEFLTWEDFDLSRIKQYSWISKADASDIERIRSRWTAATEVFSMATWDGSMFTAYSEGGRAFRPHLLHHDYGAGRASILHSDILQLFSSSNSINDIKPALAALIAHGLDIWHHMYGRNGFPGKWQSGAGQWGGQFTAPALAAALLVDPHKSIPLRRVAVLNLSDDENSRGPAEMRQIKRGVTGVLLWGDSHRPNPPASTSLDRSSHIRYWNDMKWGGCYDNSNEDCNPNVGKKVTADPHGYIDGPPTAPGSFYFQITLGNQRGLAAIMLLQPSVRAVVNNDWIIEFADRVHRAGRWTYPDPVASIPPVDQSGCDIWSGDGSGSGCEEYMITWGPRPDDTRYAIENGDGRYTSVHGKSVNPVFTSSIAEANWTKIINFFDGSRYEDTFSGLDRAVHPDIWIYPGEQGMNKVFMWAATHDAQIYYTVDGSAPTQESAQYTQPFPAPDGGIVKAIAVKSGKANSKVNTFDLDSLANDLISTAPPTAPSGLQTN